MLQKSDNSVSTDPQKFVFEELGIASWLIALWQREREQHKAKTGCEMARQTFADIGCGNGFLTHVLRAEVRSLRTAATLNGHIFLPHCLLLP